jgi:hypothetical protein
MCGSFGSFAKQGFPAPFTARKRREQVNGESRYIDTPSGEQPAVYPSAG